MDENEKEIKREELTDGYETDSQMSILSVKFEDDSEFQNIEDGEEKRRFCVHQLEILIL